MSDIEYYVEKLKEIKNLIPVDPQRAISLLDVELNMPYIPEKYEAEFVRLREELDFSQKVNMKVPQLSDEEAMEYLNSGDDIKEAAAIDHLGKMNIRNYINEVVAWLNKNGSKKKVARTFIYETLVAQEIDVELNFDGITLNPSINGSILSDQEVITAFSMFEDEVQEEPHLLDAVNTEFKHYLLVTFPTMPKDGAKLAKDFVVAFKEMFTPKGDLTKDQEEIINILKA